ncbi:putative Dual specificity protein phosphatase 12 [Blattamonas nauphoetae]|uniref:protein-tyrosine-phosphatase n=1 Tax=Blattamonas nauphoetae TaxID=2049346 RepID=A0ABQ9XF84_9EUKA|nr:putative Dual specificity protein phosphatase 12 [Blattamonas nauphoetae]KAK2956085.1 putative Dual specificity protein phosphatase 12 [Blattamonas nauphoetae]
MSYKCKMCRVEVFTEDAVMQHEPMGHQRKKKGANITETCSSVFIEKPEWLSTEVEEGDILCPKCHKKLGYYRWSGEQCNCGTWITPAFQISKGKIDEPVRTPVVPEAAPIQQPP